MNAEKTVLIVDDEWMLVETIAYNLEKTGLRVEKALDGESGLAKAQDARPQLVILDLMLPKLSGWEVCRLLRQDPDYRLDAPILILSALANEADRTLSLELGANDFLLKPFSMQELVGRARQLLGLQD